MTVLTVLVSSNLRLFLDTAAILYLSKVLIGDLTCSLVGITSAHATIDQDSCYKNKCKDAEDYEDDQSFLAWCLSRFGLGWTINH